MPVAQLFKKGEMIKMENILLLAAVCFCSCSAILSFCTGKRIIVSVFWYLSVSMITAAAALMVAYQVLSKFEYQYVYSHTCQNDALIYKISSLWSGQEGSFLIWAFILSIMGFFVLRIKDSDRVFGIYAAISFCIFIMCFISQPFAKLSVIPVDGLGLNEALKDPFMVIHPPLVFISYSAMAVLFAFSAILPADSKNRILTWLRVSWFFLGIGILTATRIFVSSP
jgi:cytochrome c-type biogenesis protein CcmF